MSFEFLFESVGAVMSWLYDLCPSYGVMIIGATLIALVATTPLTLKATRSMLLMQRVQPEVRKLQHRHRNDRQRLNDELGALYREHRINPLGGCVPLFVQWPVFAVLSAMLHGLVRRAPDVGSAVGWITGHAPVAPASVAPLPDLVHRFDPAYLPTGRLADDLHASSTLPWLGMNLADSFQTALTTHGLLPSLPYVVLVAVVALTGIVNQRQSRRSSGPAPSDPLQGLIARVTPLVLPVVSLTLPAGLVLYFAVTNLYRLGQYAVVAR